MKHINNLLGKVYQPFDPTPFSFSLTEEAATHNSALIKSHDFDLTTTLNKLTPGTQLQYGSEFRPASELKDILHFHPLWKKTERLLTQGSIIPLLPSNPIADKEDVALGLKRGNHKGANNQPAVLHKLVEKDVTHGFALPIDINTASNIVGGAWAPLNITEQWSINEKGDRIEKKRLTHDQSFKGLKSNESINDRLDEEKLEPLIYGYMFSRFLHMIHAMRLAHPFLVILICKYDLDSAYRRMHLNSASAAKCICMTTVCALIYLRLTFGGSSSPAEWCVIIEILTDLANDITNNPFWNHSTTYAREPDPSKLPPPLLKPENDTFVQALPVDVDLQLPRHGWIDSYIDDIIGICTHQGNNAIRTTKAILLAIYLFARPSSDSKNPIPHKYLLSIVKMIAEGRQSEIQTVLGWVVDTRAFIVQLPQDKCVAYSKQVNEVIRLRRSSNKNLESIIGRLERVSYAVPHARFFLNRLRHLQLRTTNQHNVHIPKSVILDLELFLKFINRARQGTSVNNLVFRRPSHFTWADSCPFGLGGYSTSGRAWRYYIPPSMRSLHTNNVLEYIASVVTIWLDILEGTTPKYACILGCSDSSSTVGWLHRSNFDQEERPIHEDISRHLACILMEAYCTLYSQHQKGKYNVIADILSRWHFLSDIELTIFLKTKLYTQMPTSFHLSQLPNEISLWITSTLVKLQETTQCRMKPTKTETERGNDGCPGWQQWASQETPTLRGLSLLNESDWLAVLPSVFVDANTVLQDTRNHWLQAQSTRPSPTWQRPFRTTTCQIPVTTPTEQHIPTSNLSPVPLRRPTQKKRHKKPSPPRS